LTYDLVVPNQNAYATLIKYLTIISSNLLYDLRINRGIRKFGRLTAVEVCRWVKYDVLDFKALRENQCLYIILTSN